MGKGKQTKAAVPNGFQWERIKRCEVIGKPTEQLRVSRDAALQGNPAAEDGPQANKIRELWESQVEKMSIQPMRELAEVNWASFYRDRKQKAHVHLATALRDAVQRTALSQRRYRYRRSLLLLPGSYQTGPQSTHQFLARESHP